MQMEPIDAKPPNEAAGEGCGDVTCPACKGKRYVEVFSKYEGAFVPFWCKWCAAKGTVPADKAKPDKKQWDKLHGMYKGEVRHQAEQKMV
jgi:hypothetical protein